MAKVKEQTVTYTTSKLASPKKLAEQLLKKLDDSSTYDEIMYELYVMKKIEKGLKDIEEGRVIPHEHVKRELRKWLK
jgi:predicted transcriptional regulator